MFRQYKDILFESQQERIESAYVNQIKEIEKFFGWSFLQKNISNDNIKNFYEIGQMKLQDVFDYLVVAKQQTQVEKWRTSKNAVAL